LTFLLQLICQDRKIYIDNQLIAIKKLPF
jgi:hypothetical protein